MAYRDVSRQRVCLNFPAKVNSPGLLGVQEGSNPLLGVLDFAAPRLMLQMSVFLITCILLRRFFRRNELPAIFWQMIVGCMLGNINFFEDVLIGENSKPKLQESAIKVLGSVSWFGFMFFLFLEGVKMDPSLVRKVGWKPVCIGILSVAVPVAAAYIVLGHKNVTPQTSCPTGVWCATKDLIRGGSRFPMWISFAMSSFPVIRCLLSELRIVNSELGRFGLSTALISDLFSHLGMVTFGVFEPRKGWSSLLERAGKTLFFIVCLIVIRFGMKWLIRRRPDGAPVKDELLYAVLVLFVISPNIAMACEMFPFSGPFLLGLAVPEGPPLGSALVDKFEPAVWGVLLPLSTVACALRIKLPSLKDSTLGKDLLQHGLDISLPMCSKFLLIILLLLLFKMPSRDSLALAFLLSTKGVVELAIYSALDDHKIDMDDDLFLIMGVIILVLATLPPLIVRKLYDPSRKYMTYENRNIMHCRMNEELRILACIDLPSNVVSMIHLLDASSPSPTAPIAVDVLHLVQLRGRATPLFISHGKKRNVISHASYSENVVLAFDNFESENPGAVAVNVFTAVSPASLMHEDICLLALDRNTSLIIIPFHRRRLPDGSIQSEDANLRNINCNMLDRSPCSVGILVEGSRFTKGHGSPDQRCSSVAMIFLGGNDDREALVFANRSAQERRIALTVIHLKAASEKGKVLDTYDKIYDNEVLSFGKKNPHVRFVEEEVNGGADTSRYLKSIGDVFDLIIVGRRNNMDSPQASGLKEWSEFPELGIIGDLLASEDVHGGTSVLVIQQQQQQHNGMTTR